MRIHAVLSAALVLGGICCTPRGVTNPARTGLSGTVTRGPVMPVCQAGVPCDAPFSADFSVESHGRVVAGFRSDSLGHFEVQLAPGAYVVVPGAGAPIISPTSQTKQVVVADTGITVLQLEFDTGIR